MAGRVRGKLATMPHHFRFIPVADVGVHLLDSHPTARGFLRLLAQLAAVMAIVYAGQVTLEAKGIPDPTFWTSGLVGDLHWLFVACGTLAGTATAIGSLYLIHRIRAVQRTKAFNELAQDLTLSFCEGSKLTVHTLATHIWRVRRRRLRESCLERVGIFKMDPQVPSSGIRWVKGKGAVGLGWTVRQGVVVDLQPHPAKVAEGPGAFNALPAAERLNLTHDEFRLVEHYWCVYVVPLLSDSGRLIGIATVGCTREGQTAFMNSAAARPAVRRSTGAIQSFLRGD